jgi:hypothetical protein
VTPAGISQPLVFGIFYKTNRRGIASFRGGFYLSWEEQPETFDALLRATGLRPLIYFLGICRVLLQTICAMPRIAKIAP